MISTVSSTQMYRDEPYRRDRPNSGGYYERPSSYSHFNGRGGSDEGRFRDDVGRLEAARKEREKPTRTLFIRNIKYDVTEPEVRAAFERYGDIKHIFNLIPKRGLCFISYYDQRAADKAFQEMQSQELAGRPIDIHYSLPKDDETATQQSDPTSDIDPNNSGTVFVHVRGATETITLESVSEFFSQYGELKDVRPNKNDPSQFFVEFHDLRACRDAVNGSQNALLKGGQLMTRYAFSSAREKPALPAPGPVGRGGRMSHDYPRSGSYDSGRGPAPSRYPPPRDDYSDRSDQRYAGSSGSSYNDRGSGSYYPDRDYDDRDRRPSRDSYSRERNEYEPESYLQSSRLPPVTSNPLQAPPSASSIVQAGLNLQAMLGGVPQPQMYAPPQAPPPQQPYYPQQQQYHQVPQHAPPPVDSQAAVLNQMTQLAEYLKQTQQRGGPGSALQQQQPQLHQMPPPQPMPVMGGPPPPMMPGHGQYPHGPVMQHHMGMPPQGMPQPPYQPYYG